MKFPLIFPSFPPALARKTRIIIVLVCALWLATTTSRTVFVAGTPRVNEYFLAALQRHPGVTFKVMVASLFDGFQKRKYSNEYAAVSGVEYTQVAKTYTTKEDIIIGERNVRTTTTTGDSADSPEIDPSMLIQNGYEQSAGGIYTKIIPAEQTAITYVSADAQWEESEETLPDGTVITILRPL